MKILFVCTGNTCRSPMAEALAGKIFIKSGVAAELVSAGLAVFSGDGASPHAVSIMREEGLDIRRHRAKAVTGDMADAASLVLTMTDGHKRSLLALYPRCAGKVFTLGEYAGDGQDIPDPYGQDRGAYRKCADAITDKLCAIIRLIKEGVMGSLHVTDHPLVQSKIAMLRNIETGNKEFRELVGEIATLICYEATRDIPLTEVEIETPIGRTQAKFCERKFGIVPILRAGLGMVEGISRLLPTAKIGHIGLYRDPESLEPVEYYCKLPPDCEEREILLLDPMLATGGTAAAAIGYLKDRGVRRIKLLCLIAAPEGVTRLLERHPDVDIYTAAYDECLNSHGYIVPGLGDAGDRLFGTK